MANEIAPLPEPDTRTVGVLIDVPSIALAVALVVLVFGALYLLGRHFDWFGRPSRWVPGVPETPEQEYRRIIESLEGQSGGEIELLAEATRQFLHRRFGEVAFFLTTTEMRGDERRDRPPPAPRAEPFLTVLRKCEERRFAPEIATASGDLCGLLGEAWSALELLERDATDAVVSSAPTTPESIFSKVSAP